MGALPEHVAIIMDGNGRWATGRGLPRAAGHRAGVENIRSIVRACPDLQIRFLTLYAFSTENWNRPGPEVNILMTLFAEFLDRETHNLHDENVRIRHLGTTERLSPALRNKVRQALELTENNTGLTLSVCLDYGGRADIVHAVRQLIAEGMAPAEITEDAISARLYTAGLPDPDLIIRTSGEFRLSNFLIWQAAYTEYYSSPAYWPDFGPDELQKAIAAYGQRERRFGALPQSS